MARERARRPEAKALRLFVAFEVPDEAKRAVADAIAPLRERFPKARWAPPENQHVTLKFLGQTWPRLQTWVQERLEEAASASAPFDVRLDRLGAFPSANRARVVWAGLADEPPGTTATVAAAVDLGLAKEFTPEKRAFSAHLTVARSDPPLALSDADLAAPIEPVSWRVDRVVLFRSHLQRPAPRYEPLRVFPLGLHG